MKNTENIAFTKSDLYNLVNCINIAIKNGHGNYTWIIRQGSYQDELKEISQKISSLQKNLSAGSIQKNIYF